MSDCERKTRKEKTYCSYCFQKADCFMSPAQEIVQEHSEGCSGKEQKIEFESAVCLKCVRRMYAG